MSPVLWKVWRSKPCFTTVTSCTVLRPNPQKCPSSHCLCVLRPHFLQLSAGAFLPVSHQKSRISLFSPIVMLTGWRGEQGAVPAGGGRPALPRGRHSRAGWIWCVSTATQRCFCQQQHGLMLKGNRSSQKNPRHCNVPECLGKERVRGVSSLLVFFKYQFTLHCIHWEVLEIMGILDCGQKVLEVMGAPECGQRLGHPGIEMTQSQKAF